MKCFTYSKNKISKGILDKDTKTNLNTCALNINMPSDWDVETFLNNIKTREYSDILLYSNVKIVSGDSVSSVFPETCFMLCCLDKGLFMTNFNNSSLEIKTEGSTIYYVLFEDSVLIDDSNNKCVKNKDGKPIIEEFTDENTDTLDDGDDFIISL